MMKKIFILMAAALMMMSFAGCGDQNAATKANTVTKSNTSESNTKTEDNASRKIPDLKVRFGENGHEFTLHLYDNDTAAQIAKDVGETDWNLPIYHFNDFKNYEVMQYYDIASNYKFKSNPETVTSEKAGEVYYSDPNRIVLFYQDANVESKFTKVGYLDSTDGLKEAVEKNPVVEGWGNKVVSISPVK